MLQSCIVTNCDYDGIGWHETVSLHWVWSNINSDIDLYLESDFTHVVFIFTLTTRHAVGNNATNSIDWINEYFCTRFFPIIVWWIHTWLVLAWGPGTKPLGFDYVLSQNSTTKIVLPLELNNKSLIPSEQTKSRLPWPKHCVVIL